MLSSTHSEGHKSAPQVSEFIQSRLDAFVHAGHDADALAAELAAICKNSPDASWDVLALLDQYHRRGQLSPAVFRSVKSKTETLIFGPQAADQTPELRISSENSEKSENKDPRRDQRLPAPMEPRVLKPGSVLRGRYELEVPLGRGGMSMTFKALDRHRLELPFADRHVAIKVLRDEFSARPEAILALQDEFGVAQSLSHPNIINVFDLDHDSDLHFITMELLEGEPLSQLMELIHPRLLPPRQAFSIIREVGSALEYAHERGVVHADLKPSNIMILTLGGVRVLDFGLSNRGPSDPMTPNPAQRPRVQAATPAYASPERRKGRDPDPRDDIFSLACITYELLSGRRPYGDPSADDELRKIRLRRIRGLNRRQWRMLRRGLAPTRERRQKNVREWLDGLELNPATERSLARRVTAGRLRRRLWPYLVSALVLGAGALWLVAFTDTAPFRDQPWAVAAREYARAAVERVQDSGAAAVRWFAVEPQPSAPHETPAPAATDESDAIEEIALPSASSAAAIPVLEEPATAPLLSTAKSRVVRGPGVLSFSQDNYTVGESDTVARITIDRRAGTDGEVSFRWRTDGASARPGEDFGAFEGVTERLAAGQQTAVLYVPIMSDPVKEHTELFALEIDDPQGGASLGATSRATVIIVDDD